MKPIFALLISLATAALPAGAQESGAITPGMNPEQVTAVFGPPALTRVQGDWSYHFYTNDCLPRCGSDDVVFFRNGAVVSAVLRAPGRRFTGGAAAPALVRAQPGGPAAASGAGAGAAVGGVRVETMPSRRQPVNLGVVRGRPPAPEDTLRGDSLVVDTIPADTIPRGPIPNPGERRDLLRTDAFREDSLRLRSLRNDSARIQVRPSSRPPPER